jgi:hypothetical protein
MSWIQVPDPDGLRDLGRVLPFFLAVRAHWRGSIGDETGLAATGLDLIDGQSVALSGTSAWAWHAGAVVAVAQRIPGTTSDTSVSLVLDDADSAVEKGIQESWRTWLHLSNLLGLRPAATQITVRSLVVGASAPATELAVASGNGAPTDAPWRAVIEQATAAEGPFLELLAHADVPVPEYGPEVEGIPLGPSWLDRKITVDVDLGETERSELAALGWTVLPMNVDAVREALKVEAS